MLQFIDNQVVTSNDKEDLEYMMFNVIEEYKNWGLKGNIQKTKCHGVDSKSNGAISRLRISHARLISSWGNILYIWQKQ